MKTRNLITTLFVAIATFVQAQNTVTATITKLENSNGLVMIELVDSNNKTVAQKAVKIADEVCTVSFNNVADGTYAIRYYHDENSNGKMDTGMFGIPNEGYGFSNNARGFMGPPDFEDMLFKVNGNVKMTLKTVN